ncbi:MAG: membrane fusion protein MtrC [Verrucomicrobia bacterium]|nr:membrane fusion protein MtrC [Verrucomicrobiota bacterium]
MKPWLLSALCVTVAASAAPTGPAPATLSKEGDLTTVVLRPEAEQRLRLATAVVARRAVPGVRLFSGEVVRSLATREGTLAPLVGGTWEEAIRVADQQAVADGRVAQAEAQRDAARLALTRAESIRRSDAGSQRAVDEARATLATAEAAWRTACAQRELLGAPLDRARTWLRVAVYSGEAALLDPGAPARVSSLGSPTAGFSATPVAGPPTAQAASATIDWYYELPPAVAVRAGERLQVGIPRRDAREERLVLPHAAVLHDIHGGQWVYEAIAPHTYTRRRVQVERLAGTEAVLVSGPAAGAKVVTDGAAELFGTEFMTGK